jgi:hypothetical protein
MDRFTRLVLAMAMARYFIISMAENCAAFCGAKRAHSPTAIVSRHRPVLTSREFGRFPAI